MMVAGTNSSDTFTVSRERYLMKLIRKEAGISAKELKEALTGLRALPAEIRLDRISEIYMSYPTNSW